MQHSVVKHPPARSILTMLPQDSIVCIEGWEELDTRQTAGFVACRFGGHHRVGLPMALRVLREPCYRCC